MPRLTRRRGSSPVETALSVDHLTKSFGGRKAVDDVSFALPEGAFLSVFGPNGAGKTTLLRMLATLSRPTEGTITLAGIDVKEEPERVARGHRAHLAQPDALSRSHRRGEPPSVREALRRVRPAEARDRASGRRGAQAPSARSGAHVLARHDPARLHRPGARERPVGGAARRALLGARPPCHAHLRRTDRLGSAKDRTFVMVEPRLGQKGLALRERTCSCSLRGTRGGASARRTQFEPRRVRRRCTAPTVGDGGERRWNANRIPRG